MKGKNRTNIEEKVNRSNFKIFKKLLCKRIIYGIGRKSHKVITVSMVDDGLYYKP